MLLFKRILAFRKDEPPPDRRVVRRYCISPRFPLKTVLNLVARDEMGHPLVANDGGGRDWSGRLINISSSGARIQVPPAACAQPGDACRLKLDLEGHLLELTGRIAHVTERRDSLVYGLALDAIDETNRAAYHQFSDLIALGATLKPLSPPRPHDENFLIEHYAGEPGAELDIWRSQNGRDVAAFEFRIREYRVRGYAGGSGLDYVPSVESAAAQSVPPEHSAEVLRLFHWVVPNLPTAVPMDVREFLRHYAA
jgi:hypothetical protein